MPAFSIVVPTYGRPASLPHLLDALANQDFPANRFEVVLVDDGSKEPVEPLVREYFSRLPLRVARQPNQGPAAARNFGIRLAQGEYIVFTDDDCRPAPDWLRLLATTLETDKQAMVGGRTINGLPHSAAATLSQAIIDRLYEVWNATPATARFFTSNNMAARKDNLLAIGGFDTRYGLAGGEDRGLCDQWRGSGKRLVYLPHAVITHYQEDDATSFLKRHFRYGRGAVLYHQLRDTSLAGEAAASVQISNPFYWLRYSLSRPNGHSVLSVVALLVGWQVANLAGYLWERVRRVFSRDNRQGRDFV